MVGKSRNFGLDLLRAISILFVLVAHTASLSIELGIFGVQIFFVLSGFLVGQILLKQIPGGLNQRAVLGFWKRRWFRILPLYYLILLLKIAIFGNPYGWKMIVYFLFLQANLVGIEFFAVSWSLVVEEWFYIFLPLSSWFVVRKGFVPGKYLRFLIISIFVFFIIRFLWVYLEAGVFLYQFDCLFLGVVMALLKMHYSNTYQRFGSPWVFLIACVLLLFLIVDYGRAQDSAFFSTYHRVTWYLLVSICIACIIPFVERSRFINETLSRVRPLYLFLTWTSVLTYSIYLIHMDVFQLPVFFDSRISQLGIHIVLLYIISFLIYAMYEHPMMTLREEFTFKQYIQAVNKTVSSLRSVRR